MTTFDLYESLIRPIRDKDREVGALFLQRFLERPQYWRDWAEARIQKLPELLDPELCREDLLDYLLAIVGFTRAYDSIISRLDTDTKRKLIRLAAPLWKRLYTELGAEVTIRLLTGKTPYIRNWFDFRPIVGEVIIGEEQVGFDFWVIGDAITRFDEYTSQFRVMDDGNLDETLLLRLLEIMRPLGERFEASLVDFLDVFREGRGMWTTLVGTPATVTPDLTFSVPAGTIEAPTIPIAPPTAFDNIIAIHKFKMLSPVMGSMYVFAFFHDGLGNRYAVRIQTTAIAPVNNIELIRAVPPGVLLTTATFPIVGDAWYKLRVRCERNPATNRNHIVVFIDSNKVIEYWDVSPVLTGGGIWIQPTGTGVEIDNVELFRQPLRWATIEASGTVTSPNWVL